MYRRQTGFFHFYCVAEHIEYKDLFACAILGFLPCIDVHACYSVVRLLVGLPPTRIPRRPAMNRAGLSPLPCNSLHVLPGVQYIFRSLSLSLSFFLDSIITWRQCGDNTPSTLFVEMTNYTVALVDIWFFVNQIIIIGELGELSALRAVESSFHSIYSIDRCVYILSTRRPAAAQA